MNVQVKWVGKRRLSHISLMVAVICCILFVEFSAGLAAQPMVAAGSFHTVGLKSDGTVVAVGAVGETNWGQLEVSSWTDIVQVAAGTYNTVGLKSDGTVVAVGNNDYGQLEVSSWMDIVQVAAGNGHTVGLKSDGTVVAAGRSDWGQLEVSFWTDIVQVSAVWAHTVGLKSDGTVVAVGYNYWGQLEVSSWTDIVQVSAGGDKTVGLKSDGTVVAVGFNYSGQLEVTSWTDIVQVAAGSNQTFGLKSDGTVLAVGLNDFGQLEVSSWTDIVQVAGSEHTVGLKSDGTVVAVGWNGYGQCNVYDWNLGVGEFSIFAGFNTDTQGFAYSDDPFYNTNHPVYASGDHTSRKGYGGSGGLHVAVGNVDGKHILDGMSGGWFKNFHLDEASVVEVSLKYRLMTSQYDADECGEALVAIDGDLVMQLDKLCGRGLDTGWKTKTFRQNLSEGGHTLTAGAYNNKKTGLREKTDAYFDDISLEIISAFTPETDCSNGIDDDGDGVVDCDDPDCANSGDCEGLPSDPIIEVIDIRPILARHDITTNALGLAFNPDSNMLYLAHGSDPRLGFIYTLDVHGNLLHEFDLQSAYQPGAFPESLSYDRSSGHLFVLAVVPVGEDFESHLVEIDPQTANVFSDLLITDRGGGGGVYVRNDGIWQARFGEDIIRHYTRQGVFIEDVSVAASFPGYPGPCALTSSFVVGFFIGDTSGRRIVEVDIAGHEVAEVSTAILGDGRGFAIDSDVSTQRIFLQVNNEEIYVLSSEFIGAISEIVSIDIKPSSFPNGINPKSKGKIPVAILTTDSFDASTVDPTKVLFGATGTEAAPVHSALEDVDGDGDTDMILHFKTQETGIQCGDTSASLTGETFGGQAIEGPDSIRTVGCKCPFGKRAQAKKSSSSRESRAPGCSPGRPIGWSAEK